MNQEPLPFSKSKKESVPSDVAVTFEDLKLDLFSLAILSIESLAKRIKNSKRKRTDNPGILIEVDFFERKRKAS